jgi:predicted nucleotidyltransferase
MDKGTINLNRRRVKSVIFDMHHTLKKYGLNDNHIALFGSFYNGKPHKNSDMDIVIISEKFEGKNFLERTKMTFKAENEVIKKHVVPIDILLKTPQEYDYSTQNLFESKVIV